jgi:hypothetical protein
VNYAQVEIQEDADPLLMEQLIKVLKKKKDGENLLDVVI